MKPKTVTIYSIDVTKQVEKNVFELKVHCSSGTYIRALCRDIAKELSTCGVMRCILRTRCGNFCILDSFTLDEIKAGQFKVISAENVFDFEKVELENDRILDGVMVKIDRPDGDYRLYYNGQFLGAASVKDKVAKLFYRDV